MKYENFEKAKEIIEAIEEIENFSNNMIFDASEIGLLKADRTCCAYINNSDTLVAIKQALLIRKKELINELEKL